MIHITCAHRKSRWDWNTIMQHTDTGKPRRRPTCDGIGSLKLPFFFFVNNIFLYM